MTSGFLSDSKNFCKLLWVSCEVLFLHGYVWIHWVAKFLHHDCISEIVSRFVIVTEVLVICCFQKTKIFCTRYSPVIASSAMYFWSSDRFYFVYLARYFFSSSFTSVIIRSYFFWGISRSYNSNTFLSFSDSRTLNLYNLSTMSSDEIFVIDNKIPSHFESNCWISSFRKLKVNRSA